jgi:agmatine deiminase
VVNDKTGEVRGVDWEFNAWGGAEEGCYKTWDLDSQVKQKVTEYLNMHRYKSPFVIEGGALHVDGLRLSLLRFSTSFKVSHHGENVSGEGTLLVTEECVLNKNRNPKATREEIENHLKQFLNVDKIIWLPRGVYGDR